MIMERKIGEIFEHNNDWYQCVETANFDCDKCDFYKLGCSSRHSFNACGASRSDKNFVIFKKLEKVGEPFERNGYMYQEYKAHTYPLLMSGDAKIPTDDGFAVIIKQNKEDMETAISKDATEHSNFENIGKNLKPFNLEAAKSGKPVCTRDGRKARIICFDAKNTQPIIGLYEKNIVGIVREYLCYYHTDGRMYDDQDTGYDLMMLPEKKEGWVNIDKGGSGKIIISSPYSTKEEAIHNDNECTIDTIKVSWEE